MDTQSPLQVAGDNLEADDEAYAEEHTALSAAALVDNVSHLDQPAPVNYHSLAHPWSEEEEDRSRTGDEERGRPQNGP